MNKRTDEDFEKKLRKLKSPLGISVSIDCLRALNTMSVATERSKTSIIEDLIAHEYHQFQKKLVAVAPQE